MRGIFLDQETSGLDSSKYRVLEIAFKIIQLATGEEEYAFQSVVRQDMSVWGARDPASIAINAFSFQELEQGKDERTIGQEIRALFSQFQIVRGKAVFICQNPSFDRPFFAHFVDPYVQEELRWPYHWLDLASMYWAHEVARSRDLAILLPDEIWLSKDRIASACGLPKEGTPHRAMQGVNHLLLCYRHVVGFPE